MRRIMGMLLAFCLLAGCATVRAEEISLDALMEQMEGFDPNAEELMTPPPDEMQKADPEVEIDVSALRSFGLEGSDLYTSAPPRGSGNNRFIAEEDEARLVAAGLALPFARQYAGALGVSLTSPTARVDVGTPSQAARFRLNLPVYSVQIIFWDTAFPDSVFLINWQVSKDTALVYRSISEERSWVTPAEYEDSPGQFWYSTPNYGEGYTFGDLEPFYRQIESRSQPEPTPGPLTVGQAAFRISSDRQHIYITRPEISGGSGKVTVAYNIYDQLSNPVNYFYSDEPYVAASPGYGGLFNVFIVVTDTVTGEENTQNIGWQTIAWPCADSLTVGRAAFEVSPDRRSVFLTRPSIACRGGEVTIAYNIYDGQGNPVNYFYSADTRVAATPGYAGRFNVFIVVTDTVTGETDTQDIGWMDLLGA